MFNDGPLTIDRREGKSPDTFIYSLSGPLLLRNMFEFQAELRASAPVRLTIFDITAVPYMDSAGLGLVINHYTQCQKKGGKLLVVGANSRVMDLFKLTRVHAVLPLAATLDEAEPDA